MSLVALLPVMRYLLVGGTTFLLDIGLLFLLHGVLEAALLPSTALAYTGSLLYNFVLHRNWSFRARGDTAIRIGSYVVVEVCGLLVTLGLIALLTHLGVMYLVAKVLTTAGIVVGNFLAYRFWVFAIRTESVNFVGSSSGGVD